MAQCCVVVDHVPFKIAEKAHFNGSPCKLMIVLPAQDLYKMKPPRIMDGQGAHEALFLVEIY